jgi:hypothetical protein
MTAAKGGGASQKERKKREERKKGLPRPQETAKASATTAAAEKRNTKAKLSQIERRRRRRRGVAETATPLFLLLPSFFSLSLARPKGFFPYFGSGERDITLLPRRRRQRRRRREKKGVKSRLGMFCRGSGKKIPRRKRLIERKRKKEKGKLFLEKGGADESDVQTGRVITLFKSFLCENDTLQKGLIEREWQSERDKG